MCSADLMYENLKTNTEDEMNKLLIITWNFPPKLGGMENLIRDIYFYLSQMADVWVIAPKHQNTLKEEHIFRPGKGGFFFFSLYALITGFKLARFYKIRVFYGGSLVVVPVLVVLKILFGGRCHAYAHGLDVIYTNRLYQSLISFSLRFVDSLACNSSNTKKLIEDHFPRTPVVLIPPGISKEKFGLAPPRLFKKRYILSVGRLTERKGLVEFIQNVFATISKSHPDVDLVIVGSEPSEAVFHKVGYREKILSAINTARLENRIHLTGRVGEEELLSFYKYCECLVFPLIEMSNDVEGFGMVAIEAAACGRPTIAFNTGGVTDSVIHGETGILIAQGDYKRMTEKIKCLLDGGCPFEEIDKKIGRLYSWDLLVRKHYNLLFGKVD